MNPKTSAQLPKPRLLKIFASLVYEIILVTGVCFIASYPYVALFLQLVGETPTFIFQIYLILVCGVYFISCWTLSGQTLAMKTWHLKLVTNEGTTVTVKKNILRYCVGVPSAFFLIGFVWMLFDKQNRSLHDHLSGTRLIDVS